MIVHVTTQGARIIREGRHLLVCKNNDVYHTLFPHRLDQLILHGNITLTPMALGMLFAVGVDTVFLRRDGRYKGRLSLSEPRNVFLRKRQFALIDDDEFRQQMAASLVQGKLYNMATLLMRIKRARKIKQLKRLVEDIRRYAHKAGTADNLDTLRGLEGMASRLYFQGLGKGFQQDFGFHKRIRRPPTDPVNSVLSLLYTFCINRMYAAVRQAGLDPAPGALHDLEYGRNALPLDLVEEFRPIVADALTLSLFNLGVLGTDDFIVLQRERQQNVQQKRDAIDAVVHDPMHAIEHEEDDTCFDMPDQMMPETTHASEGKQPIRLQNSAFKRVVTAFEKKMDDEFYHPLAETRMSYGQAMVFQAKLYRRVVEGEAAQYQPLLLK